MTYQGLRRGYRRSPQGWVRKQHTKALWAWHKEEPNTCHLWALAMCQALGLQQTQSVLECGGHFLSQRRKRGFVEERARPRLFGARCVAAQMMQFATFPSLSLDLGLAPGFSQLTEILREGALQAPVGARLPTLGCLWAQSSRGEAGPHYPIDLTWRRN